MISLVLTVIGPDRAGLVEAISKTIVSHGGSWVESRMARLCGQFAGILRVSLPEGHVAALTASLESLGDDGLQIVLQRGVDEAEEALPALLELRVVGSDQPGIVSQFSKVLAESKASIDVLETECEGAPWSGEALFRAYAKVRLPDGLDALDLRRSLEGIAADLMVDVSLDDD